MGDARLKGSVCPSCFSSNIGITREDPHLQTDPTHMADLYCDACGYEWRDRVRSSRPE